MSSNKQHILLLGASGRTGQLTLSAALRAGHAVTALVRNPSSLAPQPNLQIIKGTPLQKSDIEAAFASASKDIPIGAVISTLSAARKTDNPFSAPLAPPMFVHDCVKNAVEAMETFLGKGKGRLVVMSAFGVGESWKGLPYLFRALFWYSNMRISIEDHDALDAEVRRREIGKVGMEWLFVRPARLAEDEAVEVRELGEQGKKVGLMGSVSRASVAEFLILAVEGKKGFGKAVVIAS